MELLPLAFTSGWTSGVNAYGTVVLLGLLGRFAGIEQIPAGLRPADILIIAGVLMTTLALASVGGVNALVSHLVKASLRLAVNTSPEPASTIGKSLAGDVSAAGPTTLAVLQPVAAAVVAALLLAVRVVVARVVMSRVRRGRRVLRRWLRPSAAVSR